MAAPITFSEDNSMDSDSMSYIHGLSLPVKRRLNALRKIEIEHDTIQKDFNREVLELEKKYLAKFSPLYKKRADIVAGDLEPTDEECTVPYFVTDFTKACHCEEGAHEPATEGTETGIPGFWATCLTNHMEISDLITPNDLPALQSLQDIRVSYPEDQTVYTLIFIWL